MIKAVGWGEESSFTLLSTTRKYDPNLSFAGHSSRDVSPNVSQHQLPHLWLGTMSKPLWPVTGLNEAAMSSEFWAWNIQTTTAAVVSQRLILITNSLLFNMHGSFVDKTEFHVTGIPICFQAVFAANYRLPNEQLDCTTHNRPFLSNQHSTTAWVTIPWGIWKLHLVSLPLLLPSVHLPA